MFVKRIEKGSLILGKQKLKFTFSSTLKEFRFVNLLNFATLLILICFVRICYARVLKILVFERNMVFEATYFDKHLF